MDAEPPKWHDVRTLRRPRTGLDALSRRGSNRNRRSGVDRCNCLPSSLSSASTACAARRRCQADTVPSLRSRVLCDSPRRHGMINLVQCALTDVDSAFKSQGFQGLADCWSGCPAESRDHLRRDKVLPIDPPDLQRPECPRRVAPLLPTKRQAPRVHAALCLMMPSVRRSGTSSACLQILHTLTFNDPAEYRYAAYGLWH